MKASWCDDVELIRLRRSSKARDMNGLARERGGKMNQEADEGRKEGMG